MPKIKYPEDEKPRGKYAIAEFGEKVLIVGMDYQILIKYGER